MRKGLMYFDIIVIGMGLSGLMAAKTAVESGMKVLIVGKGMGTLCLFSNTIDLLGTIPLSMEVEKGLYKWIIIHPEHPYSKVGLENIKKSFLEFNSIFSSHYSFKNENERNCLIPTPVGTLRPTYMIPNTMVPWNHQEEKRVILGFKGFKDFYADWIARRLNSRSITLSIPDLIRNEVTQIYLSRCFEKRLFRERIINEIKKHLQGEKFLGFPAILGIEDPYSVKSDLEQSLEAKIFEIPVLPPSIPGLRIFNRFKEWLIAKGATFLMGYQVTKAILKGKRCEGIEVSNAPITNLYCADRYILATGRFIGGGLKATSNSSLFETIFNLPVTKPKNQNEWFRKNFFDDHMIHEMGILTNKSFQPISNEGDIVLENIWVCGTILSGHKYLYEKSKEGIEISTGYMAVKSALEK